MKNAFFYGGIFFAAYFIFLIVTVPASLIAAQVQLPPNVTLIGVSGSSTDITVKQVQYNDIKIDNVNVIIDVPSLFLFDPEIDVTFGNEMIPGPSGKFKLSGVLGEIRAQNLDINVDANLIVKNLALPIQVDAHNELNIQIKDYLMGKPLCQTAEGQILWKEASVSSFNETVDIGRLSANLSCSNEGRVTLKVEEDNNLGLNFTARVGQNGQFNGQGFIKPGANFPKKIKPMLSFIGKPDQMGQYQLKF